MQGRVIPLKDRRRENRTARQQLLDVAAQQARVQGLGVIEYLRQLQDQARRTEEGQAGQPPPLPRAPKEKYAYLTKREVEALFEQITELRDRALFGTIYYLGLRASEASLLLRDEVNLRTKRVYVRRLKGSVGGERVMTGDCRRLLQRYLAQRGMPCRTYSPRAITGR
jgi:integrase